MNKTKLNGFGVMLFVTGLMVFSTAQAQVLKLRADGPDDRAAVVPLNCRHRSGLLRVRSRGKPERSLLNLTVFERSLRCEPVGQPA